MPSKKNIACVPLHPWHRRYRCLAETALIMLLPLLDATSSTAVARHWAGEQESVRAVVWWLLGLPAPCLASSSQVLGFLLA